MRRAHSPGRTSERQGCFRVPRAEAFSSTRSSTFRFRRRGNCCVRCRSGRCRRPGANSRGQWTPGSTPLREEPAPNGASLKEIAEAASADAEQQAIRRVLQDTKGNKSEAARLLRTDYKTLHLKMKQYGIPAAQFRVS